MSPDLLSHQMAFYPQSLFWGHPESQSIPGTYWEWKTHAAGATKWHSQQLSACTPPVTKRALSSQKQRPLRSCLTHSVVPHNAKSGQRAYLCQINQPSQLVSCLETICLGLALSIDCRQKPRQVWMSWREPKELDLEGCPDPRPPVKSCVQHGGGELRVPTGGSTVSHRGC